jgi:hypothetical protein
VLDTHTRNIKSEIFTLVCIYRATKIEASPSLLGMIL